MRFWPRRNRPDERSKALRALASVRAQTAALARWRPLADKDKGQADLDHAMRRYYGDGS